MEGGEGVSHDNVPGCELQAGKSPGGFEEHGRKVFREQRQLGESCRSQMRSKRDWEWEVGRARSHRVSEH